MSDERLRVQIDASFVTRNERSSVLTDWVSERAVYVRTDAPPRAMSLLRIRFALPPEGTVVEMHGMVARVDEPVRQSGVHGVEVSFFAKGGSAGKAWDKFVAHVRGRFPESRERPVMLSRAPEAPPPSGPHAGPRGTLAPSLLEELARGGGFFLETTQPFTLGSDLRVTLASSSGASHTFDCVVRRRTFGSAGGIGVELTNATPQSRAQLEKFLRAAKHDEPLRVSSTEIHAPRSPVMMNTLSGPGSEGTVRFVPAEDSWSSLDDGWTMPPTS